jgi:hypothetical protein
MLAVRWIAVVGALGAFLALVGCVGQPTAEEDDSESEAAAGIAVDRLMGGSSYPVPVIGDLSFEARHIKAKVTP